MYFPLLIVVILTIFHINTTDAEETKLVGGERAPHHYPYQISLQIKTQVYIAFLPLGGRRWTHNCGGSIITKYHVVTAAHCLVGYKPEKLSILAGTNKLNEGGQRYTVRDFTIHPEYVELNNSDIAVITVGEPFIFGENVKTIPYSEEEILGGQQATLTGWGYKYMIRVGNPPNDLQRARLPVISNEQCRENGMPVGPREICTLSRFGQGACGGDSGGPLTKGDGELLIGVVSYGTSICAVNTPDVYTRVSKFVTWIKKYTST